VVSAEDNQEELDELSKQLTTVESKVKFVEECTLKVIDLCKESQIKKSNAEGSSWMSYIMAMVWNTINNV
jgi:hypothetical protein